MSVVHLARQLDNAHRTRYQAIRNRKNFGIAGSCDPWSLRYQWCGVVIDACLIALTGAPFGAPVRMLSYKESEWWDITDIEHQRCIERHKQTKAQVRERCCAQLRELLYTSQQHPERMREVLASLRNCPEPVHKMVERCPKLCKAIEEQEEREYHEEMWANASL